MCYNLVDKAVQKGGGCVTTLDLLFKRLRNIGITGFEEDGVVASGPLWHVLGLDELNIDMMKALMIALVTKTFGSGKESDSDKILLSFRLLEGYTDDGRRKRYILDSGFMTSAEQLKYYDEGTDESTKKKILGTARNRLSQQEAALIRKLAAAMLRTDLPAFVESMPKQLVLPVPSFLRPNKPSKTEPTQHSPKPQNGSDSGVMDSSKIKEGEFVMRLCFGGFVMALLGSKKNNAVTEALVGETLLSFIDPDYAVNIYYGRYIYYFTNQERELPKLLKNRLTDLPTLCGQFAQFIEKYLSPDHELIRQGLVRLIRSDNTLSDGVRGRLLEISERLELPAFLAELFVFAVDSASNKTDGAKSRASRKWFNL